MNEVNDSVINRFASRYSVEPGKLFDTLRATAFKQREGEQPSDEQLLALLVVADQYNLNPFTREIYAVPDRKNQTIIPVVGIDGWCRIVNEHPQFDGVEFHYSNNTVQMEGCNKPGFEWIEAVFYRKDRKHPLSAKEFLDEVYRPPYVGTDEFHQTYTVQGPWQTHIKRQHRHKAYIQGARIAFGFAGIYDLDEALRITEGDTENAVDISTQSDEVVKAPDMEVATDDSAKADVSLVSQPDSNESAQVDLKLSDLHPEMRQKLEDNLNNYVSRAKSLNCWPQVAAYISNKYQGQPQIKRFLLTKLEEAEKVELDSTDNKAA